LEEDQVKYLKKLGDYVRILERWQSSWRRPRWKTMGKISLRLLAVSKNERSLKKLLQTLEFEAPMNKAIDRGGDLAVDHGLGHCRPAKMSRPQSATRLLSQWVKRHAWVFSSTS
jgi:hypothetical protein